MPVWDPDDDNRSHRGHYGKSSVVGANGVEDLLPLIRQYAYNGQFVLTEKGRLSITLQREAGDVLFNHCKKDGELIVCGIEIKTDTTNFLNFFLEVWSNRKWDTVGWMVTLKSDYLWYYFRQRGVMYSMDLPRLQKWSFEEGNIVKHKLRMAEVDQPNDSWGHCVPIEVIKEEIGYKMFERRHDGEWVPYSKPLVTKKNHWENEPKPGKQKTFWEVL